MHNLEQSSEDKPSDISSAGIVEVDSYIGIHPRFSGLNALSDERIRSVLDAS